jgi:hypothetical protein
LLPEGIVKVTQVNAATTKSRAEGTWAEGTGQLSGFSSRQGGERHIRVAGESF